MTQSEVEKHSLRPSNTRGVSLTRFAQTAWNALQEGDSGKAEELFCSVLARSPEHCGALWGLATLWRIRDPLRSLDFLDRLIELQPLVAPLYTTRGLLRQETDRGVDAVEDFATAACLQPDNTDALYNLGLCYSELFCPAQAADIASLLLQRRPHWPAARYLHVKAMVGLDQDLHAADAHFAALLKQDPLNVELRFARGLLRLKMGDFAHGWEAQEWRWAIEPVKSTARTFGRPRWSGEPLHGRRLLVVAEQGFGDILQFARFLPQAVESGADQVSVRLEKCRRGLKRLLGRISGIDIVGEGIDPSGYDVHCPLASLPYVLGTRPNTIPTARYARLDTADVQRWKCKLAALPRPWVGFCWAGSAEHFHDVRRSLPLVASGGFHSARLAREIRIQAASARVAETLGRRSLLEAARQDARPASVTMDALLRVTEGTLVSLQIGPRSADLDELPADLRQRVAAPLSQHADYYDTACLMRALDDVLTVDTSVAHLAGIVSSSALVIKPAAPEWRWAEHNGRSLWYPNLRLMEQIALSRG